MNGQPSQKRALVIGVDKYPQLGSKYDLKGCVNDAKLMAGVLQENFGFPSDHVALVTDEAATRDGILAAMESLASSVSPGDVVVLHYSGHGSQVRDREDDEPDGFDETIVPHDSGRGSKPNRDITDDEIYAWLLKVSKVTPYLTLIFDCCHSGTITRDVFGAGARWVEPDLRPVEELPPSPIQAETTRSLSREAGPSGWLPLGERYVLIAGCRDEESSYEYVPKDGGGSVTHGALSYFLTREMVKAGPGTTYRDVFEPASVQVTAAQSRQHPQMEGAWDREIFGVTDVQPMRFVRVQARSGAQVTLAAGAAHGMTRGSTWEVFDQGVKQVKDDTPRLGRVEIGTVKALTAEGRVLEETSSDAIQTGSRAVEEAHAYAQLGFAVQLASQGQEEAFEDLRSLIEASPLLSVSDSDAADARVYLLEPRSSVKEEDPVPQLKVVESPSWAVVGRDGRLLMPVHAADETDVELVIRENLEKAVRYQHALTLDNPNLEAALAGKVEFKLLRQAPGGEWEEAKAEAGGGYPMFREEERIAAEIVNNHTAPVYLTVLDFGLTGTISQLYPIRGASEELAPGRSIRFGVREGDELTLYFPENFPYAPDPEEVGPAQGIETFKLLATSKAADFSPLLQEGFRSADLTDEAATRSPLSDLLGMALTGHGTRDARRNRVPSEDEWITVTRAFILAPALQPGL